MEVQHSEVAKRTQRATETVLGVSGLEPGFLGGSAGRGWQRTLDSTPLGRISGDGWASCAKRPDPAHIIKRLHRPFRSDDNRYQKGGVLRRPRIWLTGPGDCLPPELSGRSFRRVPGQVLPGIESSERDRLLLLEMVNQRGTVAFHAAQAGEGLPAISGVHCLRLRDDQGFDYPDLGGNGGKLRHGSTNGPSMVVSSQRLRRDRS